VRCRRRAAPAIPRPVPVNGTAPHFGAEDKTGATLAEDRFSESEVATQEDALHRILKWMETRAAGLDVVAAGHRVVRGGPVYAEAVRGDDRVMEVLAPFNYGLQTAIIEADGHARKRVGNGLGGDCHGTLLDGSSRASRGGR